MELQVQQRDVTGKKVKTLRKEGIVPGIVYGKHMSSQTTVQFDKIAFLKVFKTTWYSTTLDLSGASKELVLVHKVDTNPVTDAVIHVDFLAVQADVKVRASVSIVLVGVSPAEKDGLGKIQLVKDHVVVEAFPRELPHNIEVDISKLATLQDGIFISDLVVDKKVTIIDDADMPVVTIAALQEEEAEATTGPVDASGAATAAAIEAEKAAKTAK